MEIENRFNFISERFLKIWELPTIDYNENEDIDEINIFEADEPKHKKLEYAIFFDQKIEVREVSKLYLEVFKQLFQLQPEIFFSTDLGKKIGLTKNPDDFNTRQPIAINDTYFIEGNIDNNGKFDKIKYALNMCGCEDELIIKYSK